MKKKLLWVIVIVFSLFLAVACSADKGAVIKILFKGPKTEGFDNVYAEYLRRTKDTLNIRLDITFINHNEYRERLERELESETSYDLVFVALWLLLSQMAARGKYSDFSGDLCFCKYPGLMSVFPEEVMRANVFHGLMCYIPLYRAYGSGIPVVHYRRDWADAWGIGPIDSFEKMELYWEAAKERGILPLYLNGGRGFFQLFTVNKYYPEAVRAGVTGFSVAGVDFMVYIKDNRLLAIAPAGAGDEAFKDFPPPFNRDFAVDRYGQFSLWRQRGFVDANSLAGAGGSFREGQSASLIGTMDDLENLIPGMSDDGAVIGEFVYDDGIRNFESESIPSDLVANNGLCIPANSKKKEDVMRFINWLFLSKENHDLFELGIEGTDYSINSDGTYHALSDYPLTWPGFGLTWNPSYVTFSELIQGTDRRYREYERTGRSHLPLPVTGFSFDPAGAGSLMTQVSAVSSRVYLPLLHGLLDDGERTYRSAGDMLKANIEECYGAGLQRLQDELARQITEHLTMSSEQ
jgi:putative aldouronate transport system substrate-binding protein